MQCAVCNDNICKLSSCEFGDDGEFSNVILFYWKLGFL